MIQNNFHTYSTFNAIRMNDKLIKNSKHKYDIREGHI